MAKQTGGQKATMGRVMHEFKHGELETSTGKPVKSRRQAVAIGMQESGSSRYQSDTDNKRSLARTKSKERRGQTAQAEKEGKAAARRTLGDGETRQALYARAKEKNIPGRSRMSKGELAKALHA